MAQKPTSAETPRAPKTAEKFAMPPMDLVTDRMLLPIDRVIAAILAGIAGSAYCCWPCAATIAGMAGCSKRTVHRSLSRLEALGWITREPAPTTRRGNLIRFQWRRPTTARPGLTPMSGGADTHVRGGLSPVADRIRVKKGDLKPEGSAPPNPEPSLTAEEMLPAMRDWASNPRHPLSTFARDELKRWEAQTGRNPAGEASLAETPRPVRETLPDEPNSTKRRVKGQD